MTKIVDQRLLSVEGAQVEEDARIEQGLGVRGFQPPCKRDSPLVAGETPLGIAGHDVAFAQRKATGIECLVDRPGERQEGLAKAGRLGIGLGDKDQAVVLIGGQRLLESPLGAKDQPAPLHVRQLELAGNQFDDLQGQQVVERRKAMAERVSADPLGNQPGNKGADLASQRDQRRQIARRQNRADQVTALRSGQGIEIGLRDQMEIAAVGFGEHQMAYAAPHHDDARLMCGTVGRHSNQAPGHHRGNRHLQIASLDRDPAHHILQRDDAQWHPAALIHDDDRIGAHPVKQQQRLAHGRRRPDGQWPTADQMAQRDVRRVGGNPRCRLSI